MTLSLLFPYAAFYIFLLLMCLFKKNSFTSIVVLFVISSIFIGLRFETAFDWTVYKEEFSVLQQSKINISSILDISKSFNHEVGFVIFSAIFSHIFSDYESLQLTIYCMFFTSFIYLSKTLNSKWITAQFFIIVSFLLFTLMMSTLRQCLAIAFLNFAFSATFRRKFPIAMALFVAAISSQLSSLIYIGIFVAAYFWRIGAGKLTFVYGLAISCISYFLLFTIARINLPLIDKLSIYLSRDFDSNIYEQILFLLTNVAMLFFSTREIIKCDIIGRIICRYLIISSSMSIALLDINTIRNRIFYESLILFVIFVFVKMNKTRVVLINTLAMLGFISFISSFIRQSRIAFLPYQNYVGYALNGHPGTGYERQAEIYRLQRQAHLR